MVQSGFTNQARGGDALEEAFEAALSHHENQRLLEAERIYCSILKADPYHFGALHNLGMLFALRQSFNEAADLLQRAVNRTPESAEAQDHLGSVLQALGRHVEAIACHDAALSLDPDNPEAHYNLGVALQALNRQEEAIASY